MSHPDSSGSAVNLFSQDDADYLSSDQSGNEVEGALPAQVVPMGYKIVDLPIITLPTMNTIQQFPCKIYKKISISQAQPISHQEVDYQWKRKCYGRIKFVQITEGSKHNVVVAAYEYQSCHLRLKQVPISHQKYYNLTKSLQYQNNWQFENKQNETISISLTGGQSDFDQFKQQWDYSKLSNIPENQGNPQKIKETDKNDNQNKAKQQQKQI